MDSEDVTYALITGASSGIGKSFAYELARQKHNLILIALPDDGLLEIGKSLSQDFQIQTRVIEIDFLKPGCFEIIRDHILTGDLKINMLINNVGIGYSHDIGDYSHRKIEEMIMLNILTTTCLTNLLIPELKKCSKSYILNMGSFGGFFPLAYKSIYSASKAFVYHFSEAISAELASSTVSVSVAMPGPVPTNTRIKKRIQEKSKAAKLMTVEPDEVAKYVLNQVFSGKKIIIPGRANRFLYAVAYVLPHFVLMRMVKNIFKGQV